MRCRAVRLVFVVLAVALPDDSLVFVIGVPGLQTVPFTAVTADNLGAQYALTAVGSADGLPALYLILDSIPFQRVNDGFMAFLNIVLRNFALIDFLLFRKKIDRELFLVREAGLLFCGKATAVAMCHRHIVSVKADAGF